MSELWRLTRAGAAEAAVARMAVLITEAFIVIFEYEKKFVVVWRC